MSLSLLGGRVGTFSEKVAEESPSMVPFNVDSLRVQIEGDTVNVRNRCVYFKGRPGPSQRRSPSCLETPTLNV
jgi:hypothetical protein